MKKLWWLYFENIILRDLPKLFGKYLNFGIFCKYVSFLSWWFFTNVMFMSNFLLFYRWNICFPVICVFFFTLTFRNMSWGGRGVYIYDILFLISCSVINILWFFLSVKCLKITHYFVIKCGTFILFWCNNHLFRK